MKTIRRNLPIFIVLLCVMTYIVGCGQTEKVDQRNTEPVLLSASQQKYYDGIVAARKLWAGCHDLAIYRYNGKYYLAANLPVNESYVAGLDGKKSKVTTCNRVAYSIENGEVKDNLTLADAGVTSVGQCIAIVYFAKGDSIDVEYALVSQLVACAF